jgi:ABC-type antimicrobial peptide transport system permease subunit
VLTDALTTAAVATLVGLAFGYGSLTVLASQLPGADGAPWPVLLLVTAMMALTAVLASWWPAHRAAHADPTAALRAEA